MILDGKLVSDKIKEELKEKIHKDNLNVTLAVIEVGYNESNEIYVRNKKKACEKIGINFLHFMFGEDATYEEVENKIIELNNDNNVDAILLQLPIKEGLDQDKLINTINPLKDVDGLTDVNIKLLEENKKCIIPCTPVGIMELFNYYNISLENKKVVIIGRSNLVGKPLYNILKNKNIDVEIYGRDITKEKTKEADILVVAIGNKYYIDKSYIKNNVILIDVGINVINRTLYGDINPECYDICKCYTPVPGGVGRMTVACVLKATLDCYYLRRKDNENNK